MPIVDYLSVITKEGIDPKTEDRALIFHRTVEHCGLRRRLLKTGRYERVQPHHSGNASHRMTNYFLINLQRHSDHHKNPQRRYPVLQHYEEAEAPQLPFGYPAMLILALVPPLWFRVMNPRLRAWQEAYG